MHRPPPLTPISLRAPDGTPLVAHRSASPPAGPWVTLVNGPSFHHVAWHHQLDYLGHRMALATWNYRGLFDSPPPADPEAYRVPDHVGDLGAVLDAVGAPQTALLAWSLGAEIALEFLRTHPTRVTHLILINPCFGRAYARALGVPGGRHLFPATVDAARRLFPLVSRVRRRAGGWPETTGWLKRLGFAGDTLDDDLFADVERAFRSVRVDAYLGLLRGLASYETAPPLASLAQPTLIIVGDRDRWSPLLASKRLARELPRGELFVVPGGTHYLPLEYPELINLRIEKFFDSHPPAETSPAPSGTTKAAPPNPSTNGAHGKSKSS
jgi:pimeloyl-ACP methyl ester carboxylesterase